MTHELNIHVPDCTANETCLGFFPLHDRLGLSHLFKRTFLIRSLLIPLSQLKSLNLAVAHLIPSSLT